MQLHADVVATFILPAVYSYTEQDWTYSAIRFVVGKHANQFLVQYVLGMVRS